MLLRARKKFDPIAAVTQLQEEQPFGFVLELITFAVVAFLAGGLLLVGPSAVFG